MKNVLLPMAVLLIFMTVDHAQASLPLTRSQQLYAVLAKSGLKAQVPFDGASSFEAFDVSCVIAVDEAKRSTTCDLANKPSSAHPNQIHLSGKPASSLIALLRSTSTLEGETGAATAFIRCSKYSYPDVDTTFECQVALPFGTH